MKDKNCPTKRAIQTKVNLLPYRKLSEVSKGSLEPLHAKLCLTQYGCIDIFSNMMRTEIHKRNLAWVFVAFYALAAVRSLVPGLCATLAPLEIQAATEACCSVAPPSGDEIAETPVHFGSCALCNLTESTSQTATEVSAPAISTPVAQVASHYESPQGNQSLWTPLSHRGPPAAA